MNNKYLSIIIICLLGIMLCMGAVSAKSMKAKNFNDFTMDVPTDSKLAKLQTNI